MSSRGRVSQYLGRMTKDLSHAAISARWRAAVDARVKQWGKQGVATRAGTTVRSVENWLGVERRSGGRTGSAGRRKAADGARVGTLPPIPLLAQACAALAIDVQHVLYGDVPAFQLEAALAGAVREALATHEGLRNAEWTLGPLRGAAILKSAVALVRQVADRFTGHSEAQAHLITILAATEDAPMTEADSIRVHTALQELSRHMIHAAMTDTDLDLFFGDG